ncbi:hypothetical protein DAPPUDRAFT_268517 [Daphnia pulex]|uniref:Uncharacterized protein n=1 Tax=Daphnia pulex TaxID=6669 RepID=E9HXX5_DAPPU|nr:hypothetical protein DAPPUDRAFT_268517 [Daphnia pulex]|eukprot:EFX63406.1 hypothetical protein DAPPUDRAFT_268517 [Daphnia pulex]
MTDNGANQQDLGAEYDSVNQMEDEVRAGKNIIILKRQEWKDFKEEERAKEAERRRRQERKDDDDARDQKMQDFMQRILATQASTTSTSATTSTTSTTTPAQTTRLPQRQIKPFKGDILEWTPFWESFNAAIHSSSIAAVQKFDYLKQYLQGEAFLCVENLELNDTNYQKAIDELKQMYGKPEVLIEAHLHKLNTLQPVKDMSDISALRSLQLRLQSHINALQTLGVDKSTYAGLLGSNLIHLLPFKLQAKWTESASNKVTDIDGLIAFIIQQVEAAERLNRLREQVAKPSHPTQSKQPQATPATASQLSVGARPDPAPQNGKSFKQKTTA